MGRIGRDSSDGDQAARIAAWVRQTFTATETGGVTLYDLTAR
ncbi:hypothetical protein [Thermoactinospora rubra]|nr:hypothetical protein [Thermoactinospora rubra]